MKEHIKIEYHVVREKIKLRDRLQLLLMDVWQKLFYPRTNYWDYTYNRIIHEKIMFLLKIIFDDL